jgi:hypothetical protein
MPAVSFSQMHRIGQIAIASLACLAISAGQIGPAAASPPSRMVSVRSPGADTPVGSPSKPPAQICGNSALLAGPATPPDGAIVVPAGDNSGFDFAKPRATYWFAPGMHTLGDDQFGQIIPGDGASFIGGPGAVLDGQRVNRYAFTQQAKDVSVRYLTLQHFGKRRGNIDEGEVNHDGGEGWTIQYNTIRENAGAGVFLGSRNLLDSNCLKANGQFGFQHVQASRRRPFSHHAGCVDQQ